MTSKKPDSYVTLLSLIHELEEWARADEMKGGGDPSSYSEIETGYQHAKAKLTAHIERMQRGDFE